MIQNSKHTNMKRHLWTAQPVPASTNNHEGKDTLPNYPSTYPSAYLHILLQSPQSILSLLQNVIVLADRKPHIVLRQMRIRVRVELGGRNRRHAKFLDQKPGELKVSGPGSNVFGEGVVLWQLDLVHVDENKVPALRVRVRHAQLVPDLVEAVHFGLHVVDGVFPESLRRGLLESYGACFLERGHGGVADACVGGGDVLKEVGGANEPAFLGYFNIVSLFFPLFFPSWKNTVLGKRMHKIHKLYQTNKRNDTRHNDTGKI